MLRIPEDQKSSLAKLLTLQEQTASTLWEAFRNSSPALSTFAFAKQVAQRAGLPLEEVGRYFEVLGSLFVTLEFRKVSVEQLAAEVVEAALAQEIEGLVGEATKVESFKSRLVKFLSLDASVGITAKAANVVFRHKNPFAGSKILTDIRPVFSPDKLEPAAGVVVHSLEIDVVRGLEQDQESYFFALDSQDLRTLRETVDRAIKKEDALRKLLAGTSLKYLPMNPEE